MSSKPEPNSYEHTTTFSSDVLAKAAALKVVDQKGNAVTFGSLFEEQRTIMVFVRLFRCGRCQDYCHILNEVPEEALVAANTRLVIIGNGEPSTIPAYYENSGLRTSVPIYTDTSRALYELFGFTNTIDTAGPEDPKRAYVVDTYWEGVWKSLARATWSRPWQVFQTGRISQNGGEMILGPGLKCTFAHRMKTTTDHLDVDELMKEAGVAYP